MPPPAAKSLGTRDSNRPPLQTIAAGHLLRVFLRILHPIRTTMSPKHFLPVVILCLLTLDLRAQFVSIVPEGISFQGYVTNGSGLPINTTVNITTTFYKGGVAGYSQVHPSVAITNGVFNLVIGPVDTVDFGEPIELGITLGGDPEISPRTPLQSAPFALSVRGMHAVKADDGSWESYNVIGGGGTNFVGDGVVGATISGGGGWSGSSGSSPIPNSVLDDFGTIGGGRLNIVAGTSSTVAGGSLNEALGGATTIGGGSGNKAAGSYNTIAGGFEGYTASTFATVGGGEGNRAEGSRSTVPGGVENRALGEASFAAGHDAKALHNGTFVWNDRSIILGDDSLVSTGPNQFLIRAAGGVGIGTNAPQEQLHIIESDGSTGIKLGGNGTAGPNGIVFEDNTTGGGVQLFWRTTNNQLVLERSSEGTQVDGTDALMYDRDDQRFVFTGFRDESATFEGHVVAFDNTATGSADGIAIRLGKVDADAGNNFISFFSATETYGRVEGNGSNGVVYGTTGGDYAEYIQQVDELESIDGGDVVGIVNGRVTLKTDSADRIMVITDRPAVLGNMPDPDHEDRYERVAFVGQVRVSVVGPVHAGDFLLPTGRNDGTAMAIPSRDLRASDLNRIAAVAWESSDDPGLKKVMAEVGLDRGAATQAVLEREIAELKALVLSQSRLINSQHEKLP